MRETHKQKKRESEREIDRQALQSDQEGAIAPPCLQEMLDKGCGKGERWGQMRRGGAVGSYHCKPVGSLQTEAVELRCNLTWRSGQKVMAETSGRCC